VKKFRVYLETTMFNYYFDTERDGHPDTVRMFEAIGRGEYEGFTSEYVTYELRNAPEPKRDEMLSLIPKYGISVLQLDDEADRLTDLYITKRINDLYANGGVGR
jgi:predicted nucleic acid-binding protein